MAWAKGHFSTVAEMQMVVANIITKKNCSYHCCSEQLWELLSLLLSWCRGAASWAELPAGACAAVHGDTQQFSQFLQLCSFLCQVRLPLLPICFLMGVVAKEEIVKQNLKCRDLLDEARNYHLHLSSRAVPDFEYSIRTTPRKQTAGN